LIEKEEQDKTSSQNNVGEVKTPVFTDKFCYHLTKYPTPRTV
jgi:hypothetical protein